MLDNLLPANTLATNWVECILEIERLGEVSLKNKILNPTNKDLIENQLAISTNEIIEKNNGPFNKLEYYVDYDCNYALGVLKLIINNIDFHYAIASKIEMQVELAVSNKKITFESIKKFLNGGIKCLEIISNIDLNLMDHDKRIFIHNWLKNNLNKV